MSPRPVSEDPPSPMGPVRVAVSVGVRAGIVIVRALGVNARCVIAFGSGLVVVVLDDPLANNGRCRALDDDFGAFTYKGPVQIRRLGRRGEAAKGDKP